MSVKGSLVSQESSASTALALMAAAHAPQACWEMGRHVQVSMSVLCMFKVCYAMPLYSHVKQEQLSASTTVYCTLLKSNLVSSHEI